MPRVAIPKSLKKTLGRIDRMMVPYELRKNKKISKMLSSEHLLSDAGGILKFLQRKRIFDY